MQTFDITIETYIRGRVRVFKFHAEWFYDTAQVARFRVYGRSKEMILEKRKLAKSSPWKLLTHNFTFNEEESARILNRIFDILDYNMKGPQTKWVNPKNF